MDCSRRIYRCLGACLGLLGIVCGVLSVALRAADRDGTSLYEEVKDTKRIESIAQAVRNLDGIRVDDWLVSLEQSEIYLELTAEAEPGFEPQARMPVTADQLQKARSLLGQYLNRQEKTGSPAKLALADAIVDGSLKLFEVRPGHGKKTVRVTRYYAAKVPARKEKSTEFCRALYRLPPDSMRDAAGKLPTKQQIHAGALEDKASAIAWLRPDDEATVQMQGSGLLLFPDGEVVSVNYEGNNGYAWTDEDEDAKHELKKTGKVSWSKWSLYKKRHTFHRELVLSEFQHLLLKRGQFLGFDRPFSRKMPVTAGISAAMDPAMVPSGALGVLVSSKGRSRLVKIDDQGAAFIDRPDKIDLFWGSFTRDELASGFTEDKRPVGSFPDWAQLFFLVGNAR